MAILQPRVTPVASPAQGDKVRADVILPVYVRHGDGERTKVGDIKLAREWGENQTWLVDGLVARALAGADLDLEFGDAWFRDIKTTKPAMG